MKCKLGVDKTEVRDFDVELLNNLIALAKRKVAGKPVSGKEILSAPESTREYNVSTLTFKQSLENIDLDHAMIIGSWLEWYVIYLKTENGGIIENLENIAIPLQVVLFGGIITLTFLSSPTELIPSNYILVSILLSTGFIYTTDARVYVNSMMIVKQMKQEVATNFLKSIEQIKTKP